METEEHQNLGETGMCEHGNFLGSCSLCVEKFKKETMLAPSEIESQWATYVPDKQFGVVLKLPGSEYSSASATLTYDDKGENPRFYLDIIRLEDKDRGRGLGRKLLERLADEGREYGAKSLYAHITSKSALKAEAAVYGAENLRFFSHETKEPLPLLFDEAMDTEGEHLNYDVEADLSKWKL